MLTKVGCAIVAGCNLPNFAKRKGQLLVTFHFKSIDIRIFGPFVYINLSGLDI